MKKLLILLFLVACQGPQCLQTGDLVFVASTSGEMDGAISAATGAFTHVAMLEVAGDSLWVIDAHPSHGVSRRTLSSFLEENGADAYYSVMRVRGFDAATAVERAKAFIGLPYDLRFLPGNDAYYCSELVQVCYGDSLFPSQPMNWLAPDGTLPSFWEENFAALGMSVPQGVPGTNPADMAASPCLALVACGDGFADCYR